MLPSAKQVLRLVVIFDSSLSLTLGSSPLQNIPGIHQPLFISVLPRRASAAFSRGPPCISLGANSSSIHIPL